MSCAALSLPPEYSSASAAQRDERPEILTLTTPSGASRTIRTDVYSTTPALGVGHDYFDEGDDAGPYDVPLDLPKPLAVRCSNNFTIAIRELFPAKARAYCWWAAALMCAPGLLIGPPVAGSSAVIIPPCVAVQALSLALLAFGSLYFFAVPWAQDNLRPAWNARVDGTTDATHTFAYRLVGLALAFIGLLLSRMCNSKDLSRAGVPKEACETEDGIFAFRASAGFCMVFSLHAGLCRWRGLSKPVFTGWLLWYELSEPIAPLAMVLLGSIYLVAAL